MKTIKIQYIPVETNNSTTIELYDVNRITEYFTSGGLTIEIDDSKQANSSDTLASLNNGIIEAIIIEDEQGNIVSKITEFTKLRSFSRSHYDVIADAQALNDNILRLTFVKELIEN